MVSSIGTWMEGLGIQWLMAEQTGSTVMLGWLAAAQLGPMLVFGIFGGLAGGAQLVSQIKGIAAVGAFSFVFAFVLFFILKSTIGIRVSEEEEIGGLDIGEHGGEAYPDFQPITEA